MAYYKFTVEGQGRPWAALIDVGASTTILSTVLTSTNIRAFNSYVSDNAAINTPVLFTFGSLRNYSGAGTGGPNYFTISESNVLSNGQYPTTGYSLDIWSDALTTAIANGAFWFSLASNSTKFALSNTKTSLIYDYSGRYAPYWVNGNDGTITFSLTNLEG